MLHGAAGLEYSYDSLLAGRSGNQVVQLGAGGQPIPAAGGRITPAAPGRTLRLTILPDLQWEAERACAARVSQVKADSCMAVVMQPRTGQVLALAAQVRQRPGAAQARPGAADPAVADVFEPGSTAKVITAAAALERGGQTPDSPYTVPYQITVDGFQFHDADLHGTERLTLAGILVHSSNVGMVQVVQHVSPQVQYQYFRNFGIGQPSGLGLPGESPGIIAPPGKWWGDQRYTLSFGQGVAINAVQLASVYATIANGGVARDAHDRGGQHRRARRVHPGEAAAASSACCSRARRRSCSESSSGCRNWISGRLGSSPGTRSRPRPAPPSGPIRRAGACAGTTRATSASRPRATRNWSSP